MATKTINLTVKVTAKSGLNYRTGPGEKYTKKGAYPYNKQLDVDREENGWYRVKGKNKYWISKQYTKIVKKNGASTVSKSDAEKSKKLTKKEQAAIKQNFLSGTSYSDYDDHTYNKAFTKNINGIYGIPYQFMASVDPRVVKSTKRKSDKGDTKRSELGFGRVYNDKIISKMPILMITPGSPNFLPSFNKKQKGSILAALSKTYGGGIGAPLSDILGNKGGRYYTFQFNYYDYFRYVNVMLQYCAKLLDIDNVKHGNGGNNGYTAKLGEFKWEYALNKDFKEYISTKEVIPFYVDAESTVNESFSTSTTQSQFASAFDSLSDMSRELQFLLGPVAGVRTKPADPDAYNKKLDEINKTIDRSLGGAKLFKNLTEAFTTVAGGGKLVFPEIWQDTEFSKSYDVTIKLRTPDGDKISWYLNILVPLIHLIALAAPQQLGPNGYKTPFLVRAFYKGLFNCDMGIITGLNINKGREGAWTIDGLPTEVDVSMTIKDLYSLLFITNDYSVKNFMNNTCLTDYLANSCGININKPEVQRTLEIYLMLHKNKIKNIPNNIFTKLEQTASNLALSAYNGISMRN